MLDTADAAEVAFSSENPEGQASLFRWPFTLPWWTAQYSDYLPLTQDSMDRCSGLRAFLSLEKQASDPCSIVQRSGVA